MKICDRSQANVFDDFQSRSLKIVKERMKCRKITSVGVIDVGSRDIRDMLIKAIKQPNLLAIEIAFS